MKDECLRNGLDGTQVSIFPRTLVVGGSGGIGKALLPLLCVDNAKLGCPLLEKYNLIPEIYR